MTESILTLESLNSLLKQVASDMKTHIEELRELDSVVGDGDLGVTVELESDAMASFLETPSEDSIGQLLAKCGMSINKASPSTFGTLLASAFLGAGQVVRDKREIGTEDLLLMGQGAIDGIKRRGKAEVGEKTLLDSVVPAVEAFEREIKSENNLTQALNAAVSAAETGMKATIDMKAVHGRASWHQKDTVGILDAGATAMYYLIESFAQALIKQTKR